MFDSDILEAAIGLALVFALVSTICTAVREWIESFLKTRASFLEFGIRQLLNDPLAKGVVRDVFNHPLISSLFVGQYEKGDGPLLKRKLRPANKHLPSYIPAASFAKALMDVLGRGSATDSSPDATSQPLSFERLRGNLAHMDNPHLQRVLLVALDSAQGDLDRLQAHLEAWFNSGMDRVSGWYKRSTQNILFVIALAIAVILNVNTITLGDYLFRHDAERSALVASLETPKADAEQHKLTMQDANKRLSEMHLPIGWTGDGIVDSWGAPRTRGERVTAAVAAADCSALADAAGKAACQKRAAASEEGKFRPWDDALAPLVGWLLTAFAATLGAPFWFDLLSKFMTVRSTVKPKEKEKEKEESTSSATVPKPGVPAATPATLAATAAAVAHADHCGVGSNIAATPDDRLPAASGGVA